jgi:hypothetical protein
VKLAVPFLLLVFSAARAQDLVFPQGYGKLDAATQSYARLDFRSGTWESPFYLFPSSVAGTEKSMSEIQGPKAWASSRGRLPKLYAPAGEYALRLWAAPIKLWDCRNARLQQGADACDAYCSAYAVLEPDQIAVSWKAEAGAHYELTASYPAPVPVPEVVWGGLRRCGYRIASGRERGTARVCLTKIPARGESSASAHCQDVRYYLALWPKGLQYTRWTGPKNLDSLSPPASPAPTR